MKNNNIIKDDFKKVEDQIRQEENEALRIFRKIDFIIRIKKKIEAEEPKFSFPIFLKLKPFFLTTMIILVVFAAWIGLFVKGPLSKNHNISGFENFLFQFPALQKKTFGEVSQGQTTSNDFKDYYDLDWSIRRILYLLYRQQRPAENLEQNIERFLSQILPDPCFREQPLGSVALSWDIKTLLQENSMKDLFSRIIKNLTEV